VCIHRRLCSQQYARYVPKWYFRYRPIRATVPQLHQIHHMRLCRFKNMLAMPVPKIPFRYIPSILLTTQAPTSFKYVAVYKYQTVLEILTLGKRNNMNKRYINELLYGIHLSLCVSTGAFQYSLIFVDRDIFETGRMMNTDFFVCVHTTF
jgi:hypothetical protein